MLAYLTLRLVMPIWYNARVCLIKLLGTALFFLCGFLLACVLLALPCHRQQQTTALTAVHSQGLTVTVVSIYGQTADTHSLRFASPIPFPCIHDIAGAQQKHGTGLGSTQICDNFLCVCVCVCVCVVCVCVCVCVCVRVGPSCSSGGRAGE